MIDKDVFDYSNNCWMAAGGYFYVNGCIHCGWEKRNHGWYSFCAGHEGSNGYYMPPTQEVILFRMKYNRAKRN